MELSQYFPIWSQLTAEEQQQLCQAAVQRTAKQGELLHNGSADCLGLTIVCSGQLRAYITSEEGREVTIFRLFERDICLFSASCMMHNIQFDVMIEAEKDCELWIISPSVYQQLMQRSAPLANYTNQLLASRFSEVMWLIEQIMWNRFDRRLAAFLLQESLLENSNTLHLTHERIASHLGTAREVVTRMLRHFQSDGMVQLTRGTIQIVNSKQLEQLTE